MATKTTNYELWKPDGTDEFDDFREEFNENMDTIDAHLGGGGGSSSLAGLSDVNLSSPSNNQVLKYNSTSQKWENQNESGGGGGDSVSWTQIQQSGTKIAEIDINGTSQNVYAPNGGGTSGDTYVDGVFTDANNMIWSQQINSGSQTYTSYDYVATEDCLFVGSTGKFNNDTVSIAVNGKSIATYGPGIASDNLTLHVYLKKGQTATFSGLGNWASAKAYGLIQGTNGIYAPVIYSDTERKIGVWRDGKPLYQKTITYHDSTSQYSELIIDDISSLDIDTFVNAFGSAYEAGWGWGSIPSDGNFIRYNTTDGNLQLDTSHFSWSNADYYITLQYTKTADTTSGADWDLTGALIPRATLLWSGSFSGSGDISVPNLADYLIIAVQNDVSTIMIGNQFTGSGALGQYQSGYPLHFAYRFGTSVANKLTIDNNNRGIMYNGATTYDSSNWCTITKIYGLFKKPV